MKLLIQASLCEPPSDSLAFRYVTLISKKNFNMDVLILTDPELKDLYYKYLKNKGLFDYIDDIVIPRENENGLRLDNNDVNYSPIIKLKAIVFENQLSVINNIKKFIR
jgi:hypothetical protein